jgi:hypothetical protein
MPMDAFVAHCRKCEECRASMIGNNNGYPGMCDVGLRLWLMLEPADQQAAYTAVWPTCAYAYGPFYKQPPEYCDNDTEPGSQYCATHRYVEEGYDNSDDPTWDDE